MMKYILFRNPDGFMNPVVFPALVKHSDMATMMPSCVPVAAGFVQFLDDAGVTVLHPYGESVSLDLETTDDAREAFGKLNSEYY